MRTRLYSIRKACMGAMDAACRAGRKLAATRHEDNNEESSSEGDRTAKEHKGRRGGQNHGGKIMGEKPLLRAHEVEEGGADGEGEEVVDDVEDDEFPYLAPDFRLVSRADVQEEGIEHFAGDRKSVV